MRRALPIVLGLAMLLALAPRPADSEGGDEVVRGVGLGLFASEPDYDYGVLVDEIADRGASDVLIAVQWGQSNTWSSDVGPREQTATDAAIRRTVRQAKAHGLGVTLMPIVRLDERTPRQWRGNIKPDAPTWFTAYRAQLRQLARLAQDTRVERLVVGSELGSMQRHEQSWRDIIAEVRTVYGGELTYSANWDDFESVRFWDVLDQVGVTGYFPVDRDEPGSSWAAPRARLAELRRVTGKPVIVTEVGYPSHRRAAERPWDQLADDVAAPRLQARLYRAFCDEAAPSVDGYFFWNWFGFGGPREVSFTPRGKPAAAELERCLTST